jgi:hypothetical protein
MPVILEVLVRGDVNNEQAAINIINVNDQPTVCHCPDSLPCCRLSILL